MSFRTVLRWIQRGELKAYKLPGRGDHRIRAEDFIEFLQRNQIPVPPSFSSGRTRILIVDDEPTVARVFAEILEAVDFEVKIAPDGFAAGALAIDFAPDLMIVDLKMPNLGGHDLISFSRAMPQLKSIKILVISGMNRKEIDRALELGADGALGKPVHRTQLIKAVNELVGLAEVSRRAR